MIVAIGMGGGGVTALGPLAGARVRDFGHARPWGIEATFSIFQPDIAPAGVDGAPAGTGRTFAMVLGLRAAVAIVPAVVGFAVLAMGPFGVEMRQGPIVGLGLHVDGRRVII